MPRGITTRTVLGGFFLASLTFISSGQGARPPQEVARTSFRMPLDLPHGGGRSEQGDEDLPETITFYGGEYEGDGFFWCLDKSCSMMGDPLATLKGEVEGSIQQLSAQADIGLVAFSTNMIHWLPFPTAATPAHKASACAWVDSLQAGGGTVLAPPGVFTVLLSNLSHKARRTIIIVSDGRPADEESALVDITSANYERNPVNTILIEDVTGMEFMQSLAALNDGSFRFLP